MSVSWSVILALGLLLNSACSVFGIRKEETPDYKVVYSEDDKEIREYKPYIVAKTTVTGEYDDAQNEGFRVLAGYIFGGNKQKQKVAMTAPVEATAQPEEIAMTAPVTTQSNGDTWTVTFMMPSEYTMESLPVPDDDRVTFEEVAERKVATITFTGSRDDDDNREKAEELKKWIASQNKYEVVSEMTSAGYDPPWTISFLRRNEVMFDVQNK